MAILPPWLYADGIEKVKQTLSSPEGRARVKNDLDRYWRFLGKGQWDRLINITADYLPQYAAMSFKEIVNEMKKRVITMKKGVVISDEVEGGYIDED